MRAQVAAHIIGGADTDPTGRLITSHLARLECRVKPLRDADAALLATYDAFFTRARVVVDLTAAVLDCATELRARHGFKTPDAIHLASAMEAGVDAFLTGHAGLAKCPGMTVVLLGYAVRQEPGLRNFLDDGRLPMTNNHSERALRFICGGRKAWLFFGSHDHATAAANLFSLIASCKLHDIDAETYLAEIIDVLPYWPRERYLELAPKYWRDTRARLRPAELAREIGPVTVPPPTPTSLRHSALAPGRPPDAPCLRRRKIATPAEWVALPRNASFTRIVVHAASRRRRRRLRRRLRRPRWR